jgi:hypothetical protein
MKARDPYRQRIAAVFELWRERHGFTAVTAAELAEDVKEALSPGKTSRQQIATAVQSLANTRVAGYVLLRHEPTGKWSSAKYQLSRELERGADEGRPYNICEAG